MFLSIDALSFLPSVLLALKDNPTGAVVLVSLAAFALVAFVVSVR
jgi:hypothetical protein